MSLEVGSIHALLGAKFSPAGFASFDAAMKRSAGSAAAFEKSSRRSGAAMNGFATTSARAGGKAEMFGKAAKVGAGAAVLGFGAVLVGATKKAATFEGKMSTLRAVSKASGTQMDAMSRQALDLGAKTGVGAGQAADALIELARGGMSANSTMKALPGTVALAQAGNMGLADAATTVVKSLATFGLQGKDATMVADGLASAANKTSMDVADFAQAFAQGGSAAKAAGFSFDETLDVMGAMADKFQSGSDMGTSLKTTLTSLAKPSAQAKAEMKRLGIEVFDGNGKIKKAAVLSHDLGRAFDGLTNKEKLKAAATIAGTDGMRTLLNLSEGTAKRMREQGAATEVAAKQNEGAAGAAKKLGASWESVQITLGKGLLPGLAQAAQVLADKLRGMAADGSLKEFGDNLGESVERFATALPYIIDAISGAMAAFNAFQGVLGIFTGDFAGAADSILGIASTVIDGVRALVSTMAAVPGPIGDAWRAADAQLEKTSNNINKLRDRIRAAKTKAQIDVVVNGDKSARSKVEALRRLPNLPAKVQQILARGDLTAKEKIQAIKALKLVPKIQQITENGALSAKQKVLALKALGLPPKMQKVLENGSLSAKQRVAALRNEVAALSGKSIKIIEEHIRINKVRNEGGADLRNKARGRASGQREEALTGEGGGPEWIVDSNTGQAMKVFGPTPVSLAAQDYVIPTEPRYRGRALGLMRALAGDLGIGAFAKGKKGKKGKAAAKPKAKGNVGPVPFKRDPLRLPVEDIQGAYDDAKGKASSAAQKVKSFDSQIGTAERDSKERDKNKKRTKKAHEAQRRLNGPKGLRAARKKALAAKKKADDMARDRKKELAEARRYQELISQQEDTAELGRLDMDRGNKTGNVGLYNAGKKKRSDAITTLRALLGDFRKHASTAKFGRDLDKQIAQADLDLATDATDKFDAPEVPEPKEPEMLTAAEQAREDQLDASVALAELTATTDDDKSALAQMVAFREGVLGAKIPTGRNDWIAQAATDVKQARESLKTLTDSSAPPDPATLKAQTEEQLASLYREYGSNFQRAPGARFFGSGAVGASGGESRPPMTVHQIMNFPSQPDALTWARSVEWELGNI